MTPTYVSNSIYGTLMDLEFQKSFDVLFKDHAEPGTFSGGGCLPSVLEEPSEEPAGLLMAKIDLPTAKLGRCVLRIDLSITTDTLGVFANRRATKSDIVAILSAWPALRAAALADAATVAETKAEIRRLTETFDRVDALSGHANPTLTPDHGSVLVTP